MLLLGIQDFSVAILFPADVECSFKDFVNR